MRKLYKNLLAILVASLLSLSVVAIDPLPPIVTPLKTPQFSISLNDTSVYMYLGNGSWLRIATQRHLQQKIDSLGYYKVPYDGALRDVNLGDKKISSTKQRLPLFNGACVVPTILDNGDGTLTVGDGEYHLSTNVDGRGTENFLIGGGIFNLTDNTTNYLVANYNNGSPILQVITDVNLINETTIIPIYTAYRSGTVLHFQNWDSLGLALANKIHQSIVKTQRYRREQNGGLGISEFPTRYLSIGAGKVWVGAVLVTIDALVTSTNNLRLYYHSGGVWTYSLQTQYNNSQYDDGTNLVSLTPMRYAVNWLFRGVESQKHLYVILGRGDYTLAQAQEAIQPAVPTIISSHAMLIGKIIIQNGATSAASIQSAFDTQFSTATPNAHNDLILRDAADAHPASSITVTPAGTIPSTTAATALNYLDGKDISAIAVSGATTKTITLTRNSGASISASFTDQSSTPPVVQTLSGTTPSWDVNNGRDAVITLSGNTTITLSNLVAGTSGNLTVINPVTAYSISFAGYTNKINDFIYSSANTVQTSGSNRIDSYSWRYDGTYLVWNGGKYYH